MTGTAEGLTPEEQEKITSLIEQVDNVTKAMAEEFYLALATRDYGSYRKLRARHELINHELSDLFKKRGDNL